MFLLTGKAHSPMISCSSPYKHDGFLPDFLCLNSFLILTTDRAEIKQESPTWYKSKKKSSNYLSNVCSGQESEDEKVRLKKRSSPTSHLHCLDPKERIANTHNCEEAGLLGMESASVWDCSVAL